SRTPPRPSDPVAPPRLSAPSSPPLPVDPPAPPGSLVPLAPPWSVVVLPLPQDSAPPAAPRHSVPPASLGSSLLPAPPQSSVAPAPRRTSGAPPLSPESCAPPCAPPWPSRSSVLPRIIGSSSPPWAPPSPALLPSPFLHLGSSLHQIHPGLCLSSSRMSILRRNLLQYRLPDSISPPSPTGSPEALGQLRRVSFRLFHPPTRRPHLVVHLGLPPPAA
ncbi:hypothetical protein M9458_021144, partial [Cirrhinus mrigala]